MVTNSIRCHSFTIADVIDVMLEASDQLERSAIDNSAAARKRETSAKLLEEVSNLMAAVMDMENNSCHDPSIVLMDKN